MGGQKSRRGVVDRLCTAACTVVATARLPLVAYGCIWDRFASPAQSVRANVRHVLRFARCDDRDARTDASRVLRNKFRVSRVQNWGVMSSLKMVFACARNLIVHRFRWYQSFMHFSVFASQSIASYCIASYCIECKRVSK